MILPHRGNGDAFCGGDILIPYFNNVAMTTGYLPLVAATTKNQTWTEPNVTSPTSITSGLKFTGVIIAPAANAADVLIQSLTYTSINGTISAGDPPIPVSDLDLSEVQVKCSGSAVLKLLGKVA